MKETRSHVCVLKSYLYFCVVGQKSNAQTHKAIRMSHFRREFYTSFDFPMQRFSESEKCNSKFSFLFLPFLASLNNRRPTFLSFRFAALLFSCCTFPPSLYFALCFLNADLLSITYATFAELLGVDRRGEVQSPSVVGRRILPIDEALRGLSDAGP